MCGLFRVSVEGLVSSVGSLHSGSTFLHLPALVAALCQACDVLPCTWHSVWPKTQGGLLWTSGALASAASSSLCHPADPGT